MCESLKTVLRNPPKIQLFPKSIKNAQRTVFIPIPISLRNMKKNQNDWKIPQRMTKKLKSSQKMFQYVKILQNVSENPQNVWKLINI